MNTFHIRWYANKPLFAQQETGFLYTLVNSKQVIQENKGRRIVVIQLCNAHPES